MYQPQTNMGGTMQPAQPAPQPVDRQVFGLLVSAEQRNGGWVRFAIQEQGKQYPTKADTKKPDQIGQAMSLMGQPVSVLIHEQESHTTNPNSGRPYINRYLNEIAPWGAGQQPQQVTQAQYAPQQQMQTQPPIAQQQSPGPVPAPIQPGAMGREKDIEIMRQAASKVAAQLLSQVDLPNEDNPLKAFVEICEAMMAYFVHGPLRFGVTPFDRPRQPQVPQHQQAGLAATYAEASHAEQQQPLGAPGATYAEPSRVGEQQDIFGAPMDAADDPGPQDGQYESVAQ